MRRKRNNKLVGIYLWKLILIIITIFVVFISVECFFLIEKTVKNFVSGFSEKHTTSASTDLNENTINNTDEERKDADTTNEAANSENLNDDFIDKPLSEPSSNNVGSTSEPSPAVNEIAYCGQTHTHKNVCYAANIPQTDILAIYNLINDIDSLPSYTPTVLDNLKNYTTNYNTYSSDSYYNNYKSYLDSNCSKIEAVDNTMKSINSNYYTYIDNREELFKLHSVLTFRNIFNLLNDIPLRSKINNKMAELKDTQNVTESINYLTSLSNTVIPVYQSFVTNILPNIDNTWYQYIINYNNMMELKNMSDNLSKISSCIEALKDLPKWDDVTKQINTYKTSNNVKDCILYLTSISTQVNAANTTFTSQSLSSDYYKYVINYENYNKLLNIPKILKCAEIIDKLPEYELVTQQINEYKANNQVDECIKYLTEISSQINEGYSNFTAEKLSSTYNTYVINYEKLTKLYDMHFNEILDYTKQIKALPQYDTVTNKLADCKATNDVNEWISYLKNEVISTNYESVYNNLINCNELNQTHYTYIVNYDNIKSLHNLQLAKVLTIIEDIYELTQSGNIDFSDAKIRTKIIATTQICKKLSIENSKIPEYIINYNVLEELVNQLNTKDTELNLTVQYYAYINIVDKIDEQYHSKTELPLIDTSGKKMPQNGSGIDNVPNNNELKKMYVLDSDSLKEKIKNELGIEMDTGDVIYQKRLSEIYKKHTYKFDRYFDDLNVENMLAFTAFYDRLTTNYTLTEIWILHADKNPESINEDDFTCIPYSEDIFFTRDLVDDGNKNAIRLSENATIRFVYETKTIEDVELDVEFYDYDITDGFIYNSKTNAETHTTTGRNSTSKQTNTQEWFAYTGASGINNIENYKNNGESKLSFGNLNTGVTWANSIWNGNAINAGNKKANNGTDTFKMCTFGMVKGLTSKGELVYADGIDAPKLFNEGEAIGKKTYSNGEYKLKFNRTGDRYLLTEVVGTQAKGLDKFSNPHPIYSKLWTNNFWPMDDAPSYGTDGHDLKFGKAKNTLSFWSDPIVSKRRFVGYKAENSVFPVADSLEDHNSYFGIRGEFTFNLSSEYVGPLEWHFYGDDDLWIFLDDKLIIDIGGVHSAVGEYANFWDYLEQGSSGLHKVTFFYTERGSSGSTCWMRFALPQINEAEKDPNKGNIRLEKEVIGSDTKEEFYFTVTLKDKNNQELNEYYQYRRYNSEGTEIKQNIIKSGGIVRFNKDEYIIIEGLPENTTYSIEEVENPEFIVESENSTGNIIAGQTVTAKFINTHGTKPVKIIKQWDDNNSIENRPQEIQVKLVPKFIDENTGENTTPPKNPDIGEDNGGEGTGSEETGEEVSGGDAETGNESESEGEETSGENTPTDINTCEEYFKQHYPGIELVVSLNESNHWTYEWSALPKYMPIYDQEGQTIIKKREIEYSAEEIYTNELLDKYYSLPSYKNENGDIVLTNVLYRNIEITKVDADDNSIKLGEAKFKLQKMQQLEEGTWQIDETEEPIFGETAKDEENLGKLTFTKLKYGKYCLTEEKAPDGYNINKDIKEITINEDNLITTEIEFINKKGAILPFTGGAGKNLFVISGLAIVILTILRIRKINLAKSKPKRRRRKPIK